MLLCTTRNCMYGGSQTCGIGSEMRTTFVKLGTRIGKLAAASWHYLLINVSRLRRLERDRLWPCNSHCVTLIHYFVIIVWIGLLAGANTLLPLLLHQVYVKLFIFERNRCYAVAEMWCFAFDFILSSYHTQALYRVCQKSLLIANVKQSCL